MRWITTFHTSVRLSGWLAGREHQRLCRAGKVVPRVYPFHVFDDTGHKTPRKCEKVEEKDSRVLGKVYNSTVAVYTQGEESVKRTTFFTPD